MTQQAVDLGHVKITPSDTLWLRFRVVALLSAARAMASTERWKLAQMVTTDVVRFFDLAERAEHGAVFRTNLPPTWLDVLLYRARMLDTDGYAEGATAYRDIVATLKKYAPQ